MSRDSKGDSGGNEGTGSTKKAKRVTYERQLDDVTKELRASKTGANGKSGKKLKLRPEQEVVLLEQKCILLMKLKRYKEVIDDGYSIIGRLGPNVTLFKCILIALVRMGKAEEEILELFEAWRKATPKCPHLIESKRKFDGFLAALRSGMRHTDIFSGIEDALSLNAEAVLTKQLSDVEENKWRFRAPPPRHTTFSMCPRATSGSSCIYGEECLFAHSQEELKEWKLRGESDKKSTSGQDDMASENGDRTVKKRPIPTVYRSLLIPPLCIHYLLDMGKRIKESTDIQQILAPEIPCVTIRAVNPLKHQRRLDGFSNVQCQWSFCVSSKMPMGTVSILHDANRELFSITSAHYYNKKKETIGLIELHPNNQVQTKLQVLNTFIAPSIFLRFNSGWPEMCFYKVDVTFESMDPFPELGLYRQSIVFDFKKDPKVVKNICIEVLPKIEPIGTHIQPAPIKSPWAAPVNRVVEQPMNLCSKTELNLTPHESPPLVDPFREDKLSNLPSKAVGFKSLDVLDSESGQPIKLNSIVQSGSFETENMKDENLFTQGIDLTEANYRVWMHDFLDVEQSTRHATVKQIKTLMTVSLSRNYSPSLECSYKYNCSGELYGKIETPSDVLLDSKLEDIIMSSCSSIMIYTSTDSVTVSFKKTTPRYVCKIVEKSKSAIFIAIGKFAVDELLLSPNTLRQLHVQFAVDNFIVEKGKLAVNSLSTHHMKILFPQLENADLPFLKVPSLALMISQEELFFNNNQQTVYNLITGLIDSHDDVFVPPILVSGGASTGKSHVLAHSLRGLLRTKVGQSHIRVLICCQTDAAADAYITDYLHKWLVDDQLSVQRSKPLRIYDTDRFVDSVGGAVKHYCLFNYDGSGFRYPTKEEVLSHRILIVTLASCSVLLRLALESDTFSHVFIDESANCVEVESIQPIALCGKSTRIVVAGDVLVTPLEKFYPQVKTGALSLLERLRNKYPFRHPFVINLVQNYTSIEAILKFVSATFYHDQLQKSSKYSSHPELYPLGFHHISVSKELRADNGGGFYNMEEIRGILEFIEELLRSWPSDWGQPQDKDGIVVVTPYINHITGLRVQLQLKGLQWITVDSVSSLISKRFKVVIISTVRNHKFTDSNSNPSDDYSGFFSNKWLVKVALSSAKCLVRVFGDLCSLIQHGECRSIWHKFAVECQIHNALLGFTVQEGLHLEKESNSNYTSPLHQEKPSPVVSCKSKMAANFNAHSLNNTALMLSEKKCDKKENVQSKLNGILKLNDLNSSSNKERESRSETSSPWNTSPLSSAPTTDLFSAFSSDTKSLYSTSPLPPSNLMNTSESSGATPRETAVDTVVNNFKPDSEQFPTLESTTTPVLKFKSKPLVDIDGNPIDLACIRPSPLAASTQKVKAEPFKDLIGLDFMESQQMPLPEPTIPSQVLFDTKVYSGENFKPMAKGMEFINDSVGGAAQSPCFSPRKFTSPLTRGPPGFAPIGYDTNGLNFSSYDAKGSYPSSPQKSYLSSSKSVFKRSSTYEMPPRMLRNMQVSTNPSKSPVRRQPYPNRPPTAAEMNFFEELGLDSQRESCRSNSSASSDQSVIDSDETLSIVREGNSILSPDSDWIEVKSARKGKHSTGRKSKERKNASKQLNDGSVDSPAPNLPELCVDDKIDIITEMGFSKSEAIKALQSCEKDLQRAVDWLISKPISS